MFGFGAADDWSAALEFFRNKLKASSVLKRCVGACAAFSVRLIQPVIPSPVNRAAAELTRFPTLRPFLIDAMIQAFYFYHGKRRVQQEHPTRMGFA
jgi:hypothetical protein